MHHQNRAHRMLPKKYFCAYCRERRYYCFSFESIEDMHGHWLSNHTDLPVADPFHFHAVEMVGCHYCHYSGLYFRLKFHHNKHHPDDQFVIARQMRRDQCSLCNFSGPDLMDHFHQTHEIALKADIFNPVCYTPDTLAELLSIDIHKKRRCNHCGYFFETDHEAKIHHYNEHANMNISLMDFNEHAPNQISYLICGLCDSKIAPDAYFNHIELEGKASHGYLNLFLGYLKTKVVFGNGLIAFKQNLLFTPYDDRKQFEELIQRMNLN